MEPIWAYWGCGVVRVQLEVSPCPAWWQSPYASAASSAQQQTEKLPLGMLGCPCLLGKNVVAELFTTAESTSTVCDESRNNCSRVPAVQYGGELLHSDVSYGRAVREFRRVSREVNMHSVSENLTAGWKPLSEHSRCNHTHTHTHTHAAKAAHETEFFVWGHAQPRSSRLYASGTDLSRPGPSPQAQFAKSETVVHCFPDAGLVKPSAKPKMTIEMAATNTDIKALCA